MEITIMGYMGGCHTYGPFLGSPRSSTLSPEVLQKETRRKLREVEGLGFRV